MPIAIPAGTFYRLAVLCILSIIGACSVSEAPHNRYQSDLKTSQPENRPTTELQNQALVAINQEQYQLAVDYLQRAIKIEPRNAWSWHYLAQTYWRDAQFQRCLSMIERSNSYGSYDKNLAVANDELHWKCQ